MLRKVDIMQTGVEIGGTLKNDCHAHFVQRLDETSHPQNGFDIGRIGINKKE